MINNECMIIADPKGNSWDFAYSIYEDLNKKNKKYHINELKVKRFRDGEPKVKIKENIRRKNCFLIHDSRLEPADWFLQLAFANEAMKNSSAAEIVDVLPYMKFNRQDRKDESRVSINAKVVAEVIGLYADRVLTIDSHFTQIQGVYRIPFDNLYSSNVLLEYMQGKHPHLLEDIVVMSPDPGGTSRARKFADKFGVKNIVLGSKHRPKEGEIDEYVITGKVSGKNVLIIDDIVDSGNTLVKAAEEAKRLGAKEVYAYCTHGVFSGNAREKVGSGLDLMIVSNTIDQPQYKGVEVMSLKDFFSEAIYRTNEGESLSELFE